MKEGITFFIVIMGIAFALLTVFAGPWAVWSVYIPDDVELRQADAEAAANFIETCMDNCTDKQGQHEVTVNWDGMGGSCACEYMDNDVAIGLKRIEAGLPSEEPELANCAEATYRMDKSSKWEQHASTYDAITCPYYGQTIEKLGNYIVCRCPNTASKSETADNQKMLALVTELENQHALIELQTEQIEAQLVDLQQTAEVLSIEPIGPTQEVYNDDWENFSYPPYAAAEQTFSDGGILERELNLLFKEANDAALEEFETSSIILTVDACFNKAMSLEDWHDNKCSHEDHTVSNIGSFIACTCPGVSVVEIGEVEW